MEMQSRTDISPESESLQLSLLSLKKDMTFRPHTHVVYERSMPKAQESWVVITGSVMVYFYDTDDTLISTFTLSAGDASVTYHGGHNYLSLADDTIVYEYKTGPYLGVKTDKRQFSV
jgi:cupin fold WbuC family metalloprotein